MPILTRLTFIGAGKETTQGTGVAPTFFLPAQGISPEDVIGEEVDDSIQANASLVQAVYQTVKDTTFDFDILSYYESIGNLLVAAGLVDTVGVGRSVADGADTSSTTITSATAAFVAGDVGSTITGTDIPAGTTIASVTNGTTAVLSAATTGTGSGRSWVIAGGSGTWQHKFKVPASGAQPPSYTFADFDGVETRWYPGQVLDQLDLTIDAKAIVKLSAKFKGWPSIGGQSKPTPTWPVLPAALGWSANMLVGGVAMPRGVSYGLTIKRSTEGIHTAQNTQNPYNVFAGPIEADGKLKAIVETNTEYAHQLNNDQVPIVVTLTSPTGSPAPVLTLTGTKVAWIKETLDRGSKYIQLDADLKYIYNATDAGPFQALISNSVSTAY